MLVAACSAAHLTRLKTVIMASSCNKQDWGYIPIRRPYLSIKKRNPGRGSSIYGKSSHWSRAIISPTRIRVKNFKAGYDFPAGAALIVAPSKQSLSSFR